MIEAHGLNFRYGKKHLFESLQLSLGQGHICGLLGLNGAGKSTLLKLLGGLLFPLAGEIRVLGEEPARRRPRLLSRLFMLAEEIYLPPVSGADYLNARSGFYPRFERAAFAHYAAEFELPALEQKLNHLSYGQRKKFLMAFGLASGTDLLLLDEPTNGLDIPAKSSFRRILAEALRPERSFIISTHQVGDIRSLVDWLIIVHEGRIVLARSTAEIEQLWHMKRSDTPPPPAEPGLLYSEATAYGHCSIWEGPGPEGSLDWEILFNAVLNSAALKNAGPAQGVKCEL